jgi:hypothetical protein
LYSFIVHNLLNTDYASSLVISAYNDGKGIKISLEFVPQLPRAKPNKKCCKNAKAPSVNKVFYMHELIASLYNLVSLILRQIDRNDNEKFYYAVPNRELDADGFYMSYTIPHSDNKDIQLSNDNDFQEMFDEVTTKRKLAIKLKIIEEKVFTSQLIYIFNSDNLICVG